MILCRPSTVLHLCKLSPSSSSPKLLSQFRHSYSFLSDTLSTSSSSSSLRVRWVSVNKPRNGQIRAFGSGGDTFYSEESVSWASLGLSDKLSRALLNVGLGQPSLVQASCIPTILSGKDVVVAAETGSGKTHGYLVPLFNSLCSAQDDSVNSESDSQRGPGSARNLSLVLCPNVTLCEQVVRMANSLCGEDGQPLLVVSSVCGRQGWPVNRPDIIVSTPGALLNNIELNDRRRLGFLRVVKYIVFDEADMLLSGGFENKVIRLIHMLRFDEKQLSRSKTSSSPESSTSSELETATSAGYDFEENGEEEEEEEEDDNDTKFDAVSDDEEESFEGAVKEVTEQKRTDWRRARKIYKRSKQYIFVAATLPLNGKKTAGAVLKRMFPEATWVSGNYLHRHNPRLKQRWVEVSVKTQVDELLKAVNEDSGAKSAASNKRTIVFANTVEAVEAVAKILANAKIECYRYHKDCKLEERAETLSLFQEKGGVLVCTDAASRGVDIQNISHVIQADFATCAVDFLHRVGRTARAGQYGCVTNFYTYANRDLVAAVRRAAELGQSVETAFSRKRGFRNKIKKQGRGNVTNKSTVVVS